MARGSWEWSKGVLTQTDLRRESTRSVARNVRTVGEHPPLIFRGPITAVRVLRTLDSLVPKSREDRLREGPRQRTEQVYKQVRLTSGPSSIFSPSFSLVPFLFGQCSTFSYLPTFNLHHPFTFTRSPHNVRPLQDRPARPCHFHCTGCTPSHQAYRSSHYRCHCQVGAGLCTCTT